MREVLTMITEKRIKISDIYFAYLATPEAFSGLAITVGITDYSTEITAANLMECFSNYKAWDVPTYGAEDTTDVQRFISKFINFKNIRKASWDRMAYAMLCEYKPTENYDKHGSITTKNPLVETEVTIASRTNSDVIASKTIHDKETSMDSTTPLEASQTVSDGFTDTHTMGGGTDTTKVKAHNIEIVDETHGNIGVTKSSELVGDEIALRALDLTHIFVSEFISEYCNVVHEDL